jgi:CheY-like chemotaxis protein
MSDLPHIQSEASGGKAAKRIELENSWRDECRQRWWISPESARRSLARVASANYGNRRCHSPERGIPEPDRARVLEMIRAHLQTHHRVFVDIVAPINPHVETPEEVRDHVLKAARYIPLAQLGTTDDFAPFCYDISTTGDKAFAKIRAARPRHRAREESSRGPLVSASDEEQKRLRTAALKNADAIVVAPQRAERELLTAKERWSEKRRRFVTAGMVRSHTLEHRRRGHRSRSRESHPTIAPTAYARADDRRRALLAGCQLHLSKPVEPREFDRGNRQPAQYSTPRVVLMEQAAPAYSPGVSFYVPPLRTTSLAKSFPGGQAETRQRVLRHGERELTLAEHREANARLQ